MNLLGQANYDPAVAVTKATTALLAMTALDTTNLRVTATVPSHGFLLFRLSCMVEGGLTFPQILLGVLSGATVVGRIAPQFAGIGASPPAATTRAIAKAEFVIGGLAAGSTAFDAAYGVELVVASTSIKYGGPDDTTQDNAFGMFQFEVWDPQPWVTTLPEGYPTKGSTGNVSQMLYALLQHFEEMSISGTTMTIKKRDQATTAETLTLNDATTPTSITRAT